MTVTQQSPWLTGSAPENTLVAHADPATVTPPVLEPAVEPVVEPVVGRHRGSGRVLRMEAAPEVPAVCVDAAVDRPPRILALAPLPPRRGAVVTLDLAADRFGPGGYAGRGAPREGCRETAGTARPGPLVGAVRVVEVAPDRIATHKPPFLLRSAPDRLVPTTLVEPAASLPTPETVQRETVPEMVARMLAQVEAEVEAEVAAGPPTPIEAFLPVEVPTVRRGGDHAAGPGFTPAAPIAPAVPAVPAAPTTPAAPGVPTDWVDEVDDAISLSLDATRSPFAGRPAGASSSTIERLEPERTDPDRVRVRRAGSDRGRSTRARTPRRSRPVLYGVLGLVLGLLVSAAGLAAVWSVIFVLG